MTDPDTPKRPELNRETAPMWALWHYHRHDIHHGMHPMNRSIAPFSDHQPPQQPVHAAPETIPDLTPKGPVDFTQNSIHPVKTAPPAPISVPRSVALLGKTEKETALAELAEKIRQFKEPSIAQTAENMVFSDGNPHSAIMLIGEAPGAEEDRQGKPFVGASGKLLDAMMASIQLDRMKTYITNVVPWRPPFNRQPSGTEIKTFLPFLQEHIHIIRPRILICVGAVAAKALLNLTQTLTQTQGQVLSYTNPLSGQEVPTWTLYHPAYLMRAPGQKRAAWEQLLCIQAFLKENAIINTSQE